VIPKTLNGRASLPSNGEKQLDAAGLHQKSIPRTIAPEILF